MSMWGSVPVSEGVITFFGEERVLEDARKIAFERMGLTPDADVPVAHQVQMEPGWRRYVFVFRRV